MSKKQAAGRIPAQVVEQIVLGFVNVRRERIDEVFTRALQRLEDGLHARHVVALPARGKRAPVVQDVGPDHRARLRAAKLLLDVLTAGRPLPDAPPNERQYILYEDLQRLIAESKAKSVDPEAES